MQAQAELERTRPENIAFRADLGKQGAESAKQIAAFNRGKQEMKAIGVADNDDLTLNVGGTHFTAKRATLTHLYEAQFRLDRGLYACLSTQSVADTLSLGTAVVHRGCYCSAKNGLILLWLGSASASGRVTISMGDGSRAWIMIQKDVYF